jgi:hypothetical protein
LTSLVVVFVPLDVLLLPVGFSSTLSVRETDGDPLFYMIRNEGLKLHLNYVTMHLVPKVSAEHSFSLVPAVTADQMYRYSDVASQLFAITVKIQILCPLFSGTTTR